MPKLAAAAVRNSQFGSGLRERVQSFALASLLRVPFASALFPHRLQVWAPEGAAQESLKAHLDSLIGTDGLWSFPITRARANRKPVIQVLDRDGQPAAFVKVGTNELTRSLVRAEQRALDTVRRSRVSTRVPSVIAMTDWCGLRLLLLTPLPLRRSTSSPPRDRITRAALEIMGIGGRTECALRRSEYWLGLREKIAALSDDRGCLLLKSWTMLDEQVGGEVVEFGAWHGDWASWNRAWVQGELLAWDFERFETGVPVGLDLVHDDLQARILDPAQRAKSVILARLEESPTMLGPAEISRSMSYVIFTVYLLEIACRWLADRQDEAGGWGAELNDIIECCDLAAVVACREVAA